jgi:transcriptional regulator with XRE-family HTH domain
MLTKSTLREERVIGYNIDRIMKTRNLSIEQFSKKVHISEMRTRAIITGSTNIQEEEIDLIVEKLGVNREDLLQSVSDDEMKDYNIHYMGTATNSADMSKIVDKVDMYVRLLNIIQADK